MFGQRERLGVRQAASESQACGEACLTECDRRGLEGANRKRVVTDGGQGLHAALEVVSPDVPRQRGGVPQRRNVAPKLPRTIQAASLKDAKTLDHAPTRREALSRCRHWERRGPRLAPKAVACLCEDLDERLTVLDVPAAQRVKRRPTNVLERGVREVRRRTRLIGGCTQAARCDRRTSAVFHRFKTIWPDRPLRALTPFT